MALEDKVQHVIVLMLENRSFDHLLGFVRGVGDLTGAESNPLADEQVLVSADASRLLEVDPDHRHQAVMRQLFLDADKPNQGFVASFVDRIRESKHPQLDPRRIMRCFAPQDVPVLARLASEFVTCRRWFAFSSS